MRDTVTLIVRFVGDQWLLWLAIFGTTYLILCCSDLKIWGRYSATGRMPGKILNPAAFVTIAFTYLFIAAGIIKLFC